MDACRRSVYLYVFDQYTEQDDGVPPRCRGMAGWMGQGWLGTGPVGFAATQTDDRGASRELSAEHT
jgi:hypothetical protein